MKKQLIAEAARMQKLAGMPISEMALPEMARTAGTGGAYSITEKGEEILKQTKASGKAPEGIKNSEIAALVFLYKAKKDGNRVQKIDYAKERNVPQPAVNPIFNSLEAKELVAREGYTSKQQEPKTSRPRPDISAVMGDLDIEEGQLKEEYSSDFKVGDKVRFNSEMMKKQGFENPVEYYKDLVGVIAKTDHYDIMGDGEPTDILYIDLNKQIQPPGGFAGSSDEESESGMDNIALVKSQGDFDMITKM